MDSVKAVMGIGRRAYRLPRIAGCQAEESLK
jgi:hypothetical protein